MSVDEPLLPAAPATARQTSRPSDSAWPLAALVLAAVLPILAFGAWSAWSTIELRRAAVEAELAASARGLQVAVDRALSDQITAIRVMATELVVEARRPDEFGAHARLMASGYPEWRAVSLIEMPEGRVVSGMRAVDGAAAPLSSKSDRDEVVRTGRPLVVMATDKGTTPATPVVLALVPVTRDGVTRQALEVSLQPVVLSSLFKADGVPATRVAAIVDSRLTIAGRSREAERFVGQPLPAAMANRIRLGQSGLLPGRMLDGKAVRSVFSQSRDTSWTAVVGVPADEVESPIRRAAWQTAASAAAMGGIAVLLAWWVGRGIVQRRRAAELALGGELDERRRVEADLRASQERLRDYSSSSADWFWETDAEHRFIHVSDAFETTLGIAQSTVMGCSRAELLAADGLNHPVAVAGHLHALAQHQAFRGFEYRLRDPEGRARWVAISGVPVFDAAGRFSGYRGVGQDVTARLDAEAAAQDSHRLLREAVENVAGGFTIYDADDRLVICNAAYLDLYATSRDLIVPGARFEDIIRQGAARGQYPEALTDPEAWVAQRVRLHQQAGGEPIEQQLDDGRWLLIIEARTPSGYIVGNRVDITVRKRAEEQVRKLSVAVEQTASSVCITDLDGNIEYVNEAFVRAMGYSRAEVIGRSPRLLKSPQTPDAVFSSLRETLAQGRTWKGEFHNRRKDGSVRVDAAIVSPLKQPDGRVTHYVGIMEDVTAIRQQAAELERYRNELEQRVATRTAQLAEALEAAQSASRAKSEFLANMSHEIRTPLNAVLGLSHLLRKGLSDPAQVSRLDKIEGAGRHLLGMLNAVLDLSKIEAGKLELEQQALDVQEVVGRGMALVAEDAARKGLALSVDVPPLPTLVGDATRLHQALLNLLSNAVKFTDAGSVQVVVQALEADHDRLLLRFEVRDTGIGIGPEQQAGLFAAFQQADNTMTRRHGGTGLGLALTRRFAELMGGNAGLNSRLGEGSVFWFTARLRRAARADAAAGGRGHAPWPDGSPVQAGTEPPVEPSLAQEASGLAGRTVLLAEDNPINREVSIELLASMGLRVIVAEDGLEAVERATAGGYELILMDMQMPRLGGLEATRRIRALPGLRQVPILALTANAFVDDRQQCLDAGMNDFISKPVHADALAAILQRWMGPSAVQPVGTAGG